MRGFRMPWPATVPYGLTNQRRLLARWSLVVSAMLLLVPTRAAAPPSGAGAAGSGTGHEHLHAPAGAGNFALVPRAGWAATADSQESTDGKASYAVDGNPSTIWHTQWRTVKPPYPHWIAIDLKSPTAFSGLVYLPRPAPNRNGNIGQYQIHVSNDGVSWGAPIATGTFADDSTQKTASFPAVTARYVRLTALTEAGGRGPWSNAAEIGLVSPVVPSTGWTVTADSQESTDGKASYAVDGNPSTIWHTQWRIAKPPHPHWIAIDLKSPTALGALVYLPRPAASRNGNIGQYQIHVSSDGVSWGSPVAMGVFADDSTQKTATFSAVTARYVRLTALTEAGGRGPWTSAAEIGLMSPSAPVRPWTVTADSEELVGQNGAAANAVDGDPSTIWHTQWPEPAPPHPHWIAIDLKSATAFGGLTYLPRPAGSLSGNIGQYQIHVSNDGVSWGFPVAAGTFADDGNQKSITFSAVTARYVRLTALTEAGGRGPWTTAAEIGLLSPSVPSTDWTVTADSEELVGQDGAAANAVDGVPSTIWHTQWREAAPPHPHWIAIDLKTTTAFSGLIYLPRPAGSRNGNIGQYQIHVSNDGVSWGSPIAAGTFADDYNQKTVSFTTVTARHVRLTALTEAGGRGPWTSAAEISLVPSEPAPDPTKGLWGAPIGFPLVPTAVAQLPDGRLLTWSAFAATAYTTHGAGYTQSALFDPMTGVVSQRTVSETQHEMFCPGTAMLPDGRLVVTGGSDSARTSIYNPATNQWTAGPDMTIPRGYQGATTLADGSVFVLGGSWSGGAAAKNGEIFSPTSGWAALPGVPVTPILTNDPQGAFRADNHGWFFTWTGDRIFHAGPSRQMNWISVSGNGSITSAGNRGDDVDAMNGDAVMYDTGKILVTGGSTAYQDADARSSAYMIDINNGVSVRKIAPMANARSFANSVVLPDGTVLVVGGQRRAKLFSDDTAVMATELWNPATERFRTLTSIAIPRTYHSVAILLPDGRVFSGGGGLCNACAANHADGQIFTPPYLLNPDGTARSRPAILTAPSTVSAGDTLSVTTDTAVSRFALIRLGAATHTLNNDQRRISLTPTASGANAYNLDVPSDRGVVVPGNYMLFALDADGVPSIAKIINVN